MKFITKIKKTAVMLLSFSLAMQSCLIANAIDGDMVPLDKEAIFDVYGNSAQNFNIVLSNNKTDSDTRFPAADKALSDRPDSKVIEKAYKKATLKGEHPRVLATKADFAAINAMCDSDQWLGIRRDQLIKEADGYIGVAPLKYAIGDSNLNGAGWADGDTAEMPGDPRLWYVSQAACNRIFTIAMAYQLTGDDKYLERGYEELEAIARYKDWNSNEHHIDAGGLAMAYGVGYDWLYEGLTEEQRGNIERGAARLGLSDYVDGYQGRNGGMLGGCRADQNHNGVMNGGGMVMAAAFMDVFPEACNYIMAECITASEYAILTYGDKGQWFEGVGYATMQMDYWAYGLATIEKLFGTCYGLDTRKEGVQYADDYIMHMECPTGSFAFSDSSATSGKSFTPAQLWWIKHYGEDPSDFDYETFAPNLSGHKLTGLLLWAEPSSGKVVYDDADRQVYYEDLAIVTMRNTWSSKTPTFAGMKGGRPAATHAHMDVGSFVFMSDGVRWCYDASSENYNLDGFWNEGKDDDGKRWHYYKMRAEAHNCLVVDLRDYDELLEGKYDGGFETDTYAKFKEFQSNDGAILAILDMTNDNYNAHRLSKVEKAVRGYYFADSRQSFVVRDEIKFRSNAGTTDVRWYMTTEQNAEIGADGKSVILTDKTSGFKKLNLEFACSSEYEIVIENVDDIEKADGCGSNKGLTRITVKVKEDLSGENFAITAKLTPAEVLEPEPISDYHKSVDNWTLGNKAPKIRASINAPLGRLPEGTKIDVRAELFAAPADSTVKLFKIANSTETEIPLDADKKAEVEISNTATYILRMYNSSNEVIATSSEISVPGCTYEEEIELWNVDFDDLTCKPPSNGTSGRSFYKNDVRLSQSNKSNYYLNGNCGVSGSIFELQSDGNDGKHIYMKTKEGTSGKEIAQMNEFQFYATEGIVMTHLDCYFKDFNASKVIGALNVWAGAFQVKEGVTTTSKSYEWVGTSAGVSINQKGEASFGGGKVKLDTNKWYTFTNVLDISTGFLDVILDGKYVGSMQGNLTGDIQHTQRMRVSNGEKNETEMYVDNFKVYNYK